MNYCCHQTVLHVQHFYIIGSSVKCWVVIYYRDTGLAVTGWIHDVGQNVLRISSETGNSSSPSHFQFFFYIAFLQEAFIRNIIMTVRINYRTVMCIINNNAGSNNNYGNLQDLTLLFKIPTCTRKGLFGIYRQFGHAPGFKFSQGRLVCTDCYIT